MLCSVFLDVSEHEEKYGNSRHLREKKRIESDIHNYNEWIKRGGKGWLETSPVKKGKGWLETESSKEG